MALSPVATFIESLRTSDLLPAAKLDEAAREAVRIKDSRMLAKSLLQRGWLTPYQANQLVQGRGADLILGPYILLERLGEGLRGQVFKGRHRIMNRVAGLNVIRKELLADPEAVEQFYREIQAASQLDHPNVVHAYDAGPAGPTHFLATEFVEGIDLQHLVKESGALPLRQAAAYIAQAALGLQHAGERGLVHRDLQPSSLLITGLKKHKPGSAVEEGDLYAWGLLKILDFGLGRVLRFGGGDAVRLKSEHGAPEYMAPEQLDQNKAVDIRADIYSLGGCFHFLLTGQVPPLGRPPPRQLRPDVPAEVVELIQYMRAAAPQDRIQAPSEVAQVLAGLFGFNLGGPVTISTPEETTAPREPLNDEETGALDDTASGSGTAILSPAEAARERRLLVVAGVVLVLGLAGFGLYWFYPRDSAPVVAATQPGTSPEADLRALVARVKSRPADAGDVWKGFIELGQRYPGTSEAREAREWLLKVPSPLDGLSASKIPQEERYAWQPKELVAVLGENRWHHWSGISRGVAYSPKGQQVASCDQPHVYLWDTTGRLQFALKGHVGAVHAVAYSPDGQMVASAGQDKTVKLWQATTGQLVATVPGHTDQVLAVAFAPDGQSFASAGNDKTVRVWDFASRKEKAHFKEHKGPVHALAFAPDSKTLASASQDGTVKLWDLPAKSVRHTLGGHKDGARSVAISPKDPLVASGAGDGTVRFWDLGSGKESSAAKKHLSAVTSLAFTADGTTLASGVVDVHFWDTATRQHRPNIYKGAAAATALAFAPAGQPLAIANGSTPLRFCDPATGQDSSVLKGHTQPVKRVALSTDCRTIATSSDDSTVKLWDAATGTERFALTGSVGQVVALAISPDSQTVAAAGRSEKGVVRLWDVDTGKLKATIKGHTDGVICLAFSVDGQTLASGSVDKTVRLWDVATGKERGTLPGATDTVTAVAFSPDGQTFAWAGNDKQVRLWDLAANQSKGVLKGHTHNLHTLSFSPDGLILASAGEDRNIRFWDAVTGKEKGVRDAQTPVHGLVYTPDGQYLVAVGGDGHCAVWKAASRVKDRDWNLPGAVYGVAAAADGRHLVISNANGTAYVLRLSLPVQ
jgi:WD40 repeat protein/serine/threonine protein kinase